MLCWLLKLCSPKYYNGDEDETGAVLISSLVSPPGDCNNLEQNSGNRPGSVISDTGSDAEYSPMSKEPPKDYSVAVANLEMHIKKTREAESSPFQQEYEVR